MNKVAQDLTIQIPPDLAEACDIRPGDEMEWEIDGKSLILTHARKEAGLTPEERVRQAARDRGWTREDLYDRGRKP